MIGTEGLEEKLQQLLNDPESMTQIMSLAQSFGASQQTAQPQEQPAVPPIDDGTMRAIIGVMQQLQRTDDSRQEALLSALKPYLAPERREKIDRAAQIARISRLASSALQNGLFGKRGG